MAINKAGGPNFQAQINRAVMNDARTIDAKEAGHAAQTGAAGKLAEKNKQNKTTKTPGEQVKLSSAAMLQTAKEADAAQDADAQNRSNVADEAAVQNRGKRQLKGGADEDDKRVGARDVKGKKESSRVFPLDDESGEAYEVTETQGKKLDALDGRTPDSILQGMPEGARNAAKATLDTQLKTKGTEKVSQLKDSPEVSAVAEEMDLDLADPEWKKTAAKPAPIQLNNKPMEPEVSSHDQALAKEAAQRKMASGEGNEAMIAS